MKIYYLTLWKGGNETLIVKNAIDEKNLYDKLVYDYPNLDDIEKLLKNRKEKLEKINNYLSFNN
jgi:hypothetical protein